MSALVAVPGPATASPVFSNPAGTLQLSPHGYAVVRLAAGTHAVEDLAELIAQLSDLLVQHGVAGLLADLRQAPVFSAEAMQWLQQHWFSGALPQPGQLFRAMLIPASADPALSVAQLREQSPAHTRYAYFSQEHAAHLYLSALAGAK